MSNVAPSEPASRPARALQSSVGLKIAMAITGVILCGFVLVHVIGNLSAFAGEESMDDYGAKMHALPPLLWGLRIVLLVSAGVHVYAYWVLLRRNRKARPQGYHVNSYQESSYASRTMLYTGPLLLVFVVYHLMHFTTGTVHPDFQDGKVYRNLITGLQVVPVAIIYVLAMILLALHLWHGVWSLLQTLGVSQRRSGSLGRRLATVFTLAVILGFVAIPIAVLAGLLQ